MKTILKPFVCLSLLGLTLLTNSVVSAMTVSEELLHTLYKNGALSKEQYEDFSEKAKIEAEEAKQIQETQQQTASIDSDLAKSLEWASRIKLKGDVRFRHENRNSDRVGQEQSRQRIRARLGAYAQINDETDAGIRIATGGGDATSTNQTLGDSGDGSANFRNKEIWLDLAYIDWHPEFAQGVHAIAGKMKQPWKKVNGGMIWDSDVNPEGIALKYAHQFDDIKLFGSAGYFILDDNINGEGVQFSGDLRLYHAGIGAEHQINEDISTMLAFNTFQYDDEEGGPFGLSTNSSGTQDDRFGLYEIISETNIQTPLLPVKLYAQYVINADTRTNQDTAWLIGIGTKWDAFSLDYNYRDLQRNAAPDAFVESDFGDREVSSRGHVIKAGYRISKNFALGLAYFAADTDDGIANNKVDTFQADLKVKF